MKLRIAVTAVFSFVIFILATFFIHYVRADTILITPQWASSATTSPAAVPFSGSVTDSSGNTYAVGNATGTTPFNFGNSVTVTGANAGSNGFLIKYNSSGVAQWATNATVSPDEVKFKGVALAGNGNIYVVGAITGNGLFNFGNGITVQAAHAFEDNIVLIKYNSSGVAQWAVSNSAALELNQFVAVSVDSNENIYAAGFVDGNDTVNFGNGKTITGNNFIVNIFVVKYNSSGTAQWATTPSSAPDQSALNGIGTDSSGNVYVAGWIVGGSVFNFGNSVTANGAAAAASNILLVKYDTSGVAQWAKTTASGSDLSLFSGINVASDGTSYPVGQIAGTGAYGLGNSVSVSGIYSGNNVLLVKYNSTGLAQWAASTTSATNDSSFTNSVVDTSGNIYVVGQLSGATNYGFGNSVAVTPIDNSPFIIIKYNSSGTPQWAKIPVSANSGSSLYGISLDSSNNIYVAGAFTGITTLDLGDGVTVYGPGLGSDSLIAKYTETTVTPTPSSTSTPTPTSSTSPGGPPSCNNIAPTQIPVIYRGVRNGTDIILWFTPINVGVTGYSMLYGYYPGDDRFGAAFSDGFTNVGASYKVSGLNPSQQYSFKMAAVNGCSSGPWSGYFTVAPANSVPGSTPTASPRATLMPSCEPKPACVDARPACNIPVPPGGWCTETPTPSPSTTTPPITEVTPPPSEGGTGGSIISVIEDHHEDFANATDTGTATGAGLVTIAVVGEVSALTFAAAKTLPIVYELTGRSLFMVPFDYVGSVGQGMWLLITGFFGPLFGYVRKRPNAGKVFDAVNGKPVAGAFVVLFSETGNLKTGFTDKLGQYELTPKPDIYNLRIDKDLYSFPSRLITVSQTVSFTRIYVPGEKFHFKNKGEKFNFLGIPVDPIKHGSIFTASFAKARQTVSFIFSKVIPVLEIAAVLISGLAAATNSGLHYKLMFIIILAFALYDLVGRAVVSRASKA